MSISLISGNTDQELLKSFLHLLTSEDETSCIENVIAQVGLFYDGDRTYVFEKNEDGRLVDNTFEWCREGVSAEMENLQGLPYDVVEPWFTQFRNSGCFFLENNDEYRNSDPVIAQILENQDIDSLIAAPITLSGEIVGFLGVDNPRANKEKLLFLTVIAASLYKEIVHARESALIKKLKQAQSNVISINETLRRSGIGCWEIYDLDTTEPKVIANPMLMSLFGYEKARLSNSETFSIWYSRIDQQDISAVSQFMEKLEDGEASEVVYQWNHPTKGKVYIRSNGTMSVTTDGKKIFTGLVSDVTNSVKKEEDYRKKLEKASHAKTVFLNNMSHDIRTPMNAILGFTKLMEDQRHDPEKISDYVEKIQKSGEYLLSIINNVLEIARIDSGKEDIDLTCTDLTEESCSVFPVLENEIKKKNLKFTAEMNITHKYVLADMVKIREITMNLMSNAIKYTPEGGSIHMHFEELPCEKEGYATYVNRISDTGIGMSKEFQKHLFDSFSRERNSTDSKVIGTGLGMSIVKKLVVLMGGTIEVESELGKGTTFTVFLPHKIVEEPQKYVERVSMESSRITDLKGKRILLAEDNDLNAEIAVTVLEGYGAFVERAEDGVICVDMLNKASSDHFDIVLMDIQMPNMNGYAATERIRQFEDPKKAGIPIIAMTANAFVEDRKNEKSVGINGHISKPVNLEELKKTLSQFV